MSRLNLICNGMMFFNEVGDNLQIVVPDIEGHTRKFCADPKPAQDRLVDLPIDEYELTGPSSGKGRLIDLLDSSGYVLLDGRKVSYSEQIAKRTSAIITVPKPEIIRLYRGSEPLSLRDMVGNCSDVMIRTPIIAHDILVLSYRGVPDGTTVTLRASSGGRPPLASVTMAPKTPLSWIIYSDEKTGFATELNLAEASEEELSAELARLRHPTALNDFLTVTAGSGSATTTLQLSGIGKSDLQPANTPIGITDRQLFYFHELPASNSGAVAKQVSGPGGCSGAARATKFG